jgi:hypothetical protein
MLSEYAVNLKKTIGRSRQGHDASTKSAFLSGYRLFQVLYVKLALGGGGAPATKVRRQKKKKKKKKKKKIFLFFICKWWIHQRK